MLKQEEIV